MNEKVIKLLFESHMTDLMRSFSQYPSKTFLSPSMYLTYSWCFSRISL